MKKMFLALLLLSASALAADKPASDKLAAGKLQQQLSAMAARFPGKVALYARDVRTGRTIALDADRPVATASVIKLPILVEAYAQARAGKLSLDDKLSLDRSNQVAGSGVKVVSTAPSAASAIKRCPGVVGWLGKSQNRYWSGLTGSPCAGVVTLAIRRLSSAASSRNRSSRAEECSGPLPS